MADPVNQKEIGYDDRIKMKRCQEIDEEHYATMGLGTTEHRK